MASPHKPDPGLGLSADAPRSSFFLRGVLLKLLGACMVLLASSSSALGWFPPFGHPVQDQPGDRSALLALSALVPGLVLRWLRADRD